MPRGGSRANAGRPAGSINRASAERQRRVLESGLTPLDYLLQIVRDKSQDTARRLDAAKASAPYVHPRLSAIHYTGDFEVQTHEERLAELEKAAASVTIARSHQTTDLA